MPPPTMTTELAITFLYYRDLTAASAFYEEDGPAPRDRSGLVEDLPPL
jgi:hypothetical protein